jgi:very-short-patch-repair endonuclease
MYKDLETHSDLAQKHPLIRALAGDPSQLPEIPDDLPTAETLDDRVSPEECFQVLDADSSQQEAIIAAKHGVSFVLQGPPGTGKSQTITNIIAECLAAGKTVLFVSEKMAALEVVKKRLDDCGLGHFCLELHSHKANKRKVIEELRRALEESWEFPASQVEEKDLSQLQNLRMRLNRYVRALHQPRGALQRTPFQIHGELARYQSAPDLPFDLPNVLEMDWERLQRMDDLLRRLTAMPQVFENHHEHPWHGCRLETWSFSLQAEINDRLENTRRLVGELCQACQEIAHHCHLEMPRTLREAHEFCRLLQKAGETPFPPRAWFHDFEELIPMAQEAQVIYREYQEQRSSLLTCYRSDVLNLDAASLLTRFETEYRTPFRIFKRRFWQDLSALRSYLVSPRQRIGYKQAMRDLKLIKAVQEKEAWIDAHQREHRRRFGKHFNGLGTRWESILPALQWIRQLVEEFGVQRESTFAAMLSEWPQDVEAMRRLCSALAQRLEKVEEEQRYWEEVMDVEASLNHARLDEVPLPDWQGWLKRLEENRGRLNEWINFQQLKKGCEEIGLADCLEMAMNRKLKASQLVSAFYKRFYQLWLDAIYKQDETLREFNSDHYSRLLEEFRRLDKKQLETARQRIQRKLASRRPQTFWVDAPSSEQMILRREIAKRRRHKPIRRLFSEIPNLLLALKPCLLMSPLSVSQFLDPRIFQFDVVIFDEASQICPEDAIGAIMRGRQLIVVGDSKQLPPTRFFTSMGLEEWDEEEELDVFESILDECASIGLPSKMLLWHYRSRHESLIAFSNYHFYDNRLNTFPSAHIRDKEFGIEFVYVPDGVYDRGKSRRNVVEARKVAELVFRHFEQFPKRSLGVVAFSEAQQMAILEEIERLRLKRREYEPFFDENRHEPFFVKNLENVQGDERDVMFFSVGYGKDATGRMSLNFGPLNSAGGERRLNVAITRARYHVKLIASIQPEEIDLSRTESDGVRLLRGYMEFARQGGDRALLSSSPQVDSEPHFDSPFEEAVWQALTERGLRVHTQVGCSGYRIDLAVVDPQNPGRYVLGIECDGATYHSSKTARDRDRLRQQVLESLGWRIHRIWSRDWIENPQRELERILAVLRETPKVLFIDGKESKNDCSPSEISAIQPSNIKIFNHKTNPVRKIQPPHVKTYVKVDIMSFLDLMEKSYHDPFGALVEVVIRIVKEEGPIHLLTVARRIATEFCGLERAGSQIRAVVYEAAEYAAQQGWLEIRGDFLWPQGMERPPVRVPPPGEPPRNIEEIAIEEIAEAAHLCLEDAFSMSRDDLILQTARLLGYHRTGRKIKERVDAAIQYLIRMGMAEIDGSVVKGIRQ